MNAYVGFLWITNGGWGGGGEFKPTFAKSSCETAVWFSPATSKRALLHPYTSFRFILVFFVLPFFLQTAGIPADLSTNETEKFNLVSPPVGVHIEPPCRLTGSITSSVCLVYSKLLPLFLSLLVFLHGYSTQTHGMQNRESRNGVM